ncbi:helix-turn-helix domain-containing protein [Clostridium sp.]|uniref:helix-turn-helix domain-containing protein n=1 Tax=Clostridium sp. TaxID=1506 RepID=UPI003463FD02
MLGQVIREVRVRNNLSQMELASEIHYSNKTISAIENNRRDISLEGLSELCGKLDDPRLYIETISKATHGVFSVPWLNGEGTDLHRSSVHNKVMEELVEAIDAMREVKIYKNPNFADKEDLEGIKYSLEQVIDVYTAAATYIAVICEEYCLSPKEAFNNQRRKLELKGYIKEE